MNKMINYLLIRWIYMCEHVKLTCIISMEGRCHFQGQLTATVLLTLKINPLKKATLFIHLIVWTIEKSSTKRFCFSRNP